MLFACVSRDDFLPPQVLLHVFGEASPNHVITLHASLPAPLSSSSCLVSIARAIQVVILIGWEVAHF